jgi:pullulanase/glycogen debranching enzyme
MTSVVINPYFDWADDRPLRIPYNGTVIYEAHVKGMTMRHRPSRRRCGAATRAWRTLP